MSDTTARASDARARLRALGVSLLVVSFLLLTQFLFGIVVNLFVTISRTHPGAGLGNYFLGAVESFSWAVTHKWPYLAPHELLGLGLVIASVTFLVRGIVSHAPRRLLVWNLVGVLGVSFAALNGLYFLIHPDVDLASMFMASGFAVVLSAVIAQLFLVGRAG